MKVALEHFNEFRTISYGLKSGKFLDMFSQP